LLTVNHHTGFLSWNRFQVSFAVAFQPEAAPCVLTLPFRADRKAILADEEILCPVTIHIPHIE